MPMLSMQVESIWGMRMRADARCGWRAIVHVTRAVLGVPDYEAWLEHCRVHHPDRALPSRAAFFRERVKARYARGGNGRCC